MVTKTNNIETTTTIAFRIMDVAYSTFVSMIVQYLPRPALAYTINIKNNNLFHSISLSLKMEPSNEIELLYNGNRLGKCAFCVRVSIGPFICGRDFSTFISLILTD